ncbi:MAG: type II toxin-antitoxin system RelE/ParE family toxin [Deltaproteobacteria bacterium]|nr:type II toxin-antitoxin system RelE/ParE family toxin [Deltaproteobacteria bacterium]MBW2034885.1 type II toxin-antitoxin system RelE/ParE family toxin [Deltaproteobacteria bacterium]
MSLIPPFNAEKFIDQLEEVCFRLEQMSERGHIPRELERIGVNDYREILFKVYRIIYQIIGSDVFIHCILDGRRNLQELLQQRLFWNKARNRCRQ